MSDAPHIYGTPEPDDKQGNATRDVDTGAQRAEEPGYDHTLNLDGDTFVVVEETSGVAYAEATRDIGGGGGAATEVEADALRDHADETTRSDGLSRNVAIGAAVGVGAGLLANLLRKAVVQAPSVLAGSWDKALAAEHRAALAIFDQIEATGEDEVAKRTTLLTTLKHAIGKHAFQEENSIYAMMRDLEMAEAADHLNHEHGYVKQYFFDLGEMPRNDPAWLPKVKEFRAMIESHMREEEDELFPRMRRTLDDAQNRHLTKLMHREGLKLA
jgi:hemerythrin-like domain-containing protein